jgi:hypothetical protein
MIRIDEFKPKYPDQQSPHPLRNPLPSPQTKPSN